MFHGEKTFLYIRVFPDHVPFNQSTCHVFVSARAARLVVSEAEIMAHQISRNGGQIALQQDGMIQHAPFMVDKSWKILWNSR
jgi:hypothetical protein